MPDERKPKHELADRLSHLTVLALFTSLLAMPWGFVLEYWLYSAEPVSWAAQAVLILFPVPGLFLGLLTLSALVAVFFPVPEPRGSATSKGPASDDELKDLLGRVHVVTTRDGKPNIDWGTIREFSEFKGQFNSPEELADAMTRLTSSGGPKRWKFYAFAHHALPNATFCNHPALLRDLNDPTECHEVTEFGMTFRVGTPLLHIWSMAQVWCEDADLPFDENWLPFEETSVQPFRRAGWSVYVVSMPKVLHAREAYFAAIVHHDTDVHEYGSPSPGTRYIVLEKATDEDGTYICEWFKGGTRICHGVGPRPDAGVFAEVVMARLLGLPGVSATPAGTLADPNLTTPHVPAGLAADAPVDIPGYELWGEIARGGMGAVYYAREVVLDRPVALKLPLVGGVNPSRVLTRFRYESRVTALLAHPGVPPVYAVGTLPDGRPFLAMKYVHGHTLTSLLKKGAAGREDWDRWARIAEELARTVGFAHNLGVVHRDLKPGNIMLGQHNEIQVMDWGLAKQLSDPSTAAIPSGGLDSDLPDGTRAGTAQGTPAYMAPEQARGDPAAFPADVFAIGAILCEVLIGSPPYGRGTAQELLARAAAGDLAASLRRLQACSAPAELVTLATNCLATNPIHRPQVANEVAFELALFREARLATGSLDLNRG